MRQKEGGGHDNFSNGPLGSRDTELLAKPPTLTLYKRENNSHAIKNAIFCRLPPKTCNISGDKVHHHVSEFYAIFSLRNGL